MKREEFLISFQEALMGAAPETVIQEHVRYYQNYIEAQMREGRMEEDILQELGNPRLLAKTIIESSKFANGDESYASDNSGWSFQGNRANQNAQEQRSGARKLTKLQGWLVLLAGVVILIGVVSLVFSVLSMFAPIILVAAVGFLVYHVIIGENGRKR